MLVEVICYLQSEKMWIVVLHNQYMFVKNYHLHWIARRTSINTYIFQSWTWLCGSFSMLFPEATAYWDKEILRRILLHCTSIRMTSKSVSQISRVLFHTGDIKIFVLRSVFFSRYVQLKRSFSDKKTPAVKSEI